MDLPAKFVDYDFCGISFRGYAQGDNLLFLASDVCRGMGISNVSKAMKSIPEDEKTKVVDNGIEKNVLKEPGLYRMIFKSKSRQAEEFRKWIFAEVIPSIRKKGYYQIMEEMEDAEKTELGKSFVRVLKQRHTDISDG
jgi:prophage antirepressor-like protein